MNRENGLCEMARLIQVGNLSHRINGRALQLLFEVHGAVQSAKIHRHFETGRSTGVGLIEMVSEGCGAAAIAALNHREHLGRVLSVCWGESTMAPAADREQFFGPTNMTREEATGKESDRQ